MISFNSINNSNNNNNISNSAITSNVDVVRTANSNNYFNSNSNSSSCAMQASLMMTMSSGTSSSNYYAPQQQQQQSSSFVSHGNNNNLYNNNSKNKPVKIRSRGSSGGQVKFDSTKQQQTQITVPHNSLIVCDDKATTSTSASTSTAALNSDVLSNKRRAALAYERLRSALLKHAQSSSARSTCADSVEMNLLMLDPSTDSSSSTDHIKNCTIASFATTTSSDDYLVIPNTAAALPLASTTVSPNKKRDVVRGLIYIASKLVDSLHSTSIPSVHHAQCMPTHMFIQEILKRSKSSFSTLQLALFYLVRYRNTHAKSSSSSSVAATVVPSPPPPPPPPVPLVSSIEKDKMNINLLNVATVASVAPLSPHPIISSATGGEPQPQQWQQQQLESLPTPPTPIATASAVASTTPPPVPANSSSNNQNQMDTRRCFLAALMLASKYLHDKTYTARAWSQISGLSTQEVNACEREMLSQLGYHLHVVREAFQGFSGVLVKKACELAESATVTAGNNVKSSEHQQQAAKVASVLKSWIPARSCAGTGSSTDSTVSVTLGKRLAEDDVDVDDDVAQQPESSDVMIIEDDRHDTQVCRRIATVSAKRQRVF